MKAKFGSAAVMAILTAFLVSAVPAHASWMLAHGASASASSLASWESTKIDGNGFEGVVSVGATVPVTIPLPSFSDPGFFFEKFKILYYAAPNCRITRIEVWDGGTMIKAVTCYLTGNKTSTFKTKFPTPYTIQRGLALKIYVNADAVGAAANRRFVLNSAGAFFVIEV